MSLRTKTLLIIGSVLTVLICSLAVVVRWISLREYASYEQTHAREAVRRARYELIAQTKEIDALAKDWAQWDDTYAYMASGNATFIQSNMVANTFAEFRLNLIALVDAGGKIKYAQAYDLQRNRYVPPTAGMNALLAGIIREQRNVKGLTPHAGISILPEGAFLLSEQPILTTAGKGPARGLFITGRYWQAGVSFQADGTQHLPSLSLFDKSGLDEAMKETLYTQPSENSFTFEPLNGQWGLAYGLLPDLTGGYTILLKVMVPRTTSYAQVVQSLRYLLLSIIVVGFASLLLAGMLLERYVISRVSKLSRQIQAISEQRNTSARIRMSGVDELAGLAQAMNGLLASLEASEGRSEREQAFLATAIDLLPFPLLILTGPENPLITNKAANDFCALSGMESWWELKVLDPHTRQVIPAEERPCTHALRGEAPRAIEGIIELPSGKEVPVLMQAAPIYHDRRVTGAVVTVQDVTELKEADRAKDEFLTVLSHELLTPLTSILGWLQFYRQHDRPELLAQTLEVIERNARRQRRLVDDLLDVSRLVNARLAVHCTPADLWELATCAEKSVGDTARERNINVVLQPPAENLPVCVEPFRIQQTVGILLSNACKFSKRGGTVTLSGWREGDKAMLAVRDTGRGIPPEMLTRIFTPFTQIERDEATGGMGLGLSLAKGLIELHGGHLSVACPADGQGTVFTISLPLTATPNAEEPEERVLAMAG